MPPHRENITKAAQTLDLVAQDLQQAHATTSNPAEEILLLEYLAQVRKIAQNLNRLSRGA